MTEVWRGDSTRKIGRTDVVVGDMAILSAGGRVPADIRLMESYELVVNEASLTSTSFPVHKDAEADVDWDASHRTVARRHACEAT